MRTADPSVHVPGLKHMPCVCELVKRTLKQNIIIFDQHLTSKKLKFIRNAIFFMKHLWLLVNLNQTILNLYKIKYAAEIIGKEVKNLLIPVLCKLLPHLTTRKLYLGMFPCFKPILFLFLTTVKVNSLNFFTCIYPHRLSFALQHSRHCFLFRTQSLHKRLVIEVNSPKKWMLVFIQKPTFPLRPPLEQRKGWLGENNPHRANSESWFLLFCLHKYLYSFTIHNQDAPSH